MAFKRHSLICIFRFISLLLVSLTLSGCYVVNFFNLKGRGGATQDSDTEVLGDDLGEKAGGRDDEALASVYSVSAVNYPAAVRPDPDLLARRLLRQFRPEGTTLARVIGEVENFRGLLGGASADFATAPASGYDATSVLTVMKVAEDVCLALVAPNSWQHPGWQTILPSPASDVATNLQFLLQRFTGVASDAIPSTKIDRLKALYDQSVATEADNSALDHYVAPCTAVVLDAQAMLM